MTNILVVGGAGYIGSHMTRKLLRNGYEVVVLDNLSSGFADAVTDAPLVIGSISDEKLLKSLLKDNKFSAVMHFASSISVGESVTNPAKYYSNNVFATFSLLESIRANGINKFIFSSSAAVYGKPAYLPIDEKHPLCPISPYGRTKLIIEELLKDYDKAYGLKYTCLRYFNAAGADAEGSIGERHDPETHLIPLVLQVLSGRRENFALYGDDYDTPDGTCIRDYVHVDDLCEAHLLALKKLLNGSSSAIYNLGYGTGYSVNKVIDSCKKITGRQMKILKKGRREGDPPSLVADATAARSELNWNPVFDNLDKIIEHAWAWEKKYPWVKNNINE
jgi:UDP-glucose 4-epimerase